MSILIATFAIWMTGSFSASANGNSAAMAQVSSDKPVVLDPLEGVARQWLLLTDAQDWEGGFDKAAEVWQQELTLAAWVAAGEQTRAPLGKAVNRKLDHFGSHSTPPASYKMVVFMTDFENRKGVTETVVLNWEDGVWKVSGYWLA